MDISICSIQQDELSPLLNLYQHLNPTDAPLPNASTLQEIWNGILSDGVPPSVADREINCFVADRERNLY